jgi:hypothetical protein
MPRFRCSSFVCILPFAATVAILGGCAANSGVVSLGADRFMVSRQAATGFSGLGTLKADALREAEQYCAKNSEAVYVLNTRESKPPYVLGNFPRAEVEFMCLDASDPRLKPTEPGAKGQ